MPLISNQELRQGRVEIALGLGFYLRGDAMAKAAMVDVDPFITRLKNANDLLSTAIKDGQSDEIKEHATNTVAELMALYDGKAKVAKGCMPKVAKPKASGAKAAAKKLPPETSKVLSALYMCEVRCDMSSPSHGPGGMNRLLVAASAAPVCIHSGSCNTTKVAAKL